MKQIDVNHPMMLRLKAHLSQKPESIHGLKVAVCDDIRTE